MTDTYDAIVVGAGPAGSASAILLANRGWRILLVERFPWPRDKPCGGCLNAAAVAILRDLGLSDLVASAGLVDRFNLTVGRRLLEIPLPPGIAIRRSQLDAALVQRAMACGAAFLPSTSAKLLPIQCQGLQSLGFRDVQLTSPTGIACVSARLILVADGLTGSFLAEEPWARWSVAPNSFFGVSSTLQIENRKSNIENHAIHMHVARGGYVGLVRLDADHFHLGAALDPIAARFGGPAALVSQILRDCRQPLAEHLTDIRLQGTGLLKRRRRTLGAPRILVLGDAASYVEPFTGQGIAWALQSARELAGLLPASLEAWPADLPLQWTRRHATTLARQQRWCRLLRPLLRHPGLAAPLLSLARLLPSLTQPIVRQVAAGTETPIPRPIPG